MKTTDDRGSVPPVGRNAQRGRPRPWLRFGEDWRYRIAAANVHRTSPAYLQQASNQIRKLVVVLRHEALGTPRLRPKGEEFFATFRCAREIYQSPRNRLEVEARILARQSLRRIAQAMKTTEAVVKQFRCFFFDVGNHLEASGRVMAWISDDPVNRLDAFRQEVLRSAYYGREHVAEFLIAHLDSFGSDHDLTTEAGRELERFELNVLIRRLTIETDRLSLKQIQILDQLAKVRTQPLPTLSGAIQQRLMAALEDVVTDESAKQQQEQRQPAAQEGDDAKRSA